MMETPHFGLAQRLGLVLTLVGVVVALATGYYAYANSKELLVRATQAEISDLARGMARRLARVREDVGRDLSMLALQPAALEMLQRPSAAREQQLQALFAALMRANDLYFQVRLIAASDFGLERVRVDRDVAGPVAVSGADMREMGHFDYVFEAQGLPVGEMYLSPIRINHDASAHRANGRPVAEMAMPVHDAKGVVWGVVVLSTDLQTVFAQLQAEVPKSFALVLANGQGDYLVHPDASKTFGFDRGRRVLLQDDVPQARAMYEGAQRELLVTLEQGDYAPEPVLASYLAVPLKVHSGERLMVMGVTRPLAPIVEQAHQLMAGTLQVVVLVVVLCAVLAFFLARILVRPLEQVRLALAGFGRNGVMGALPLQRSDEVGLLARDVHTMGQQITQQMAQLHDNQEELQHLAQHDMLTGLPNRRALHERLQHALAQARRGERALALLFVDLDRFKDINDRFGHEAGDALLVALGQRLRDEVRESDTVARVGGDEFVVMVESAHGVEQLAVIAQKLLDSVQQPVQWQGHTLQVGASIGISRFPQDGQSAQDMLANADRAMYRVKEAGRNAFMFFSE